MHIPVLLDATLGYLQPLRGARVLDATFGGGGYSRALLGCGADTVVALDRDPDAIQRGVALARDHPRLTLVEGRFGALAELVDGAFDGIVFDLGISSFQVDTAARGFSFRLDGPLDMRMGGDGPTAADLVNELDETALADIFRRYGEEPRARRVARALVERRRTRAFASTSDFAQVVRRAVGGPHGSIDPATRVFQGLRIAVNDELGELERGLLGALERLAPGGRLVVVSFHSLEDRIVKRFLQHAAGITPGVSRHVPLPSPTTPAPLELLTRKVVRPEAAECAANPRARSARLRAAQRREG